MHRDSAPIQKSRESLALDLLQDRGLCGDEKRKGRVCGGVEAVWGAPRGVAWAPDTASWREEHSG